MSDRITRTSTFWLRWPRWRSRTWIERPTRWALFRVRDFVPLFLFFLLVPAPAPNWLAWVLAIFYFVVYPVLWFRRLRQRRRWCESHAHTPWRPVDEWECIYCGTELHVGTDPAVVATSVARAASDAKLAHRRQSYYSDRR